MKRSLVIVWLLFLGYWSIAAAMGGPAPEKKEPKYRAEIFQTQVVSAPATSKNSKYKLEILKMEVSTAPSPSPEAKGSKE